MSGIDWRKGIEPKSGPRVEWWVPHGMKLAHLVPLRPDDDGTNYIGGPVLTLCGLSARYEQMRNPAGYNVCPACEDKA